MNESDLALLVACGYEVRVDLVSTQFRVRVYEGRRPGFRHKVGHDCTHSLLTTSMDEARKMMVEHRKQEERT